VWKEDVPWNARTVMNATGGKSLGDYLEGKDYLQKDIWRVGK
jgi:hypothetical protein